MNKSLVRQLKSHYGLRWAELRHRQKTGEHVLCLENHYFLNNVLPGPTLALDCLGEVYQDIIDIDTQPKRLYENLLLINNLIFKYLTVHELAELIVSHKTLAKRIIVNFNFHFLIYDRLSITPEMLLEQLRSCLATDFVIKNSLILENVLNHGYGNTFLILDAKNV